MPVGSEGSPAAERPAPPKLPHTWRPIGPLVLSLGFVLALAVVSAAAWMSFDEETQAKFTTFQLGTLIFLFLLICVAFHALGRSRVTATREKLVIVNGWRRREYAWAEIIAVHLPRGAPWVSFDLSDGETVSGVGIQGSDGARAHRAVRDLRTLAEQLAGPDLPPDDPESTAG